MVCFLVITYKRDVAPIADQIPHPFYLSQFHLSIFTGSIHPVSVCCSYMLNQNLALRLLSRRLVGNHRLFCYEQGNRILSSKYFTEAQAFKIR